MRKGKWLWVLISGIVASGAGNSWTAGVAVTFADVILENIQMGEVYNLRQLKGLDYIANNNADEQRTLTVTAQIPKPAYLREGYEAIPDPSWVRIIPERFTLGPHEDMHCSIIISVPNNPEYQGRHFQVMLVCQPDITAAEMQGQGMMFVPSVARYLRFSVGSPAPAAIQEMKRKKIFLSLNFRMEPTSLNIGTISAGQKVYLGRGEFPTLKVLNMGRETLKLVFVSAPYESRMGIEPGYVPAPDTGFLTFRKQVLKVKPNSIANIPIILNIPDKPEYRGQKYSFIVKAKVEGIEVPIEVYSRVYAIVAE